MAGPRKYTVETGDKSGRLTVICETEPLRRNNRVARMLYCECECGNRMIVRLGHFVSGHTTSCGCYKEELIKLSTKRDDQYRHARKIWYLMMDRCYNPKRAGYHIYGGRGIKVCQKWHDKGTFIEWYKEKVSPGQSVDRIDNSGNYSPENCRSATNQEQSRNTSRCRNIKWNGQIKCLMEWSEELNIRYGTLIGRLNRGWSIEKAFTTPVKRVTKSIGLIEYKGLKLSLTEWARKIGIPMKVISLRLNRYGWTISEALETPVGYRRVPV